MDDETDSLPTRYYLDLAAAFVRGRLEVSPSLSPEETFRYGCEQGLRLHKFKRAEELPRVRRVFGFLYSLCPTDLLDVGSGRGVFLWPLLDTFPELPVTAIDVRPDRVADLQAVSSGGIARLQGIEGDAQQLAFPAQAFDGVTMLEVLEHIPEPDRAVAEVVRAARRFVIVSVPSKPDDNPEHIHLFNEASLTELFRDAGAPRVHVEYVLNHLVALAVVGS
jgi:ubiquinone/menaquinone biosynthesis C-methylase UbiE